MVRNRARLFRIPKPFFANPKLII